MNQVCDRTKQNYFHFKVVYHKEFEGQKGQFTAVDDSGKQAFTEQSQKPAQFSPYQLQPQQPAQVDPPQQETVELTRPPGELSYVFFMTKQEA